MSTKTATVTLEGDGLRFIGSVGSGHAVVLDDGNGDTGARPAELLPLALAGCTAMDVISILRKKRQDVRGYRVEVEGAQMDGHPHAFTGMDVTHVVEGVGLDPAAVARAIELSATKYCSVGSTLATGITEIRHGYRIVDSETGAEIDRRGARRGPRQRDHGSGRGLTQGPGAHDRDLPRLDRRPLPRPCPALGGAVGARLWAGGGDHPQPGLRPADPTGGVRDRGVAALGAAARDHRRDVLLALGAGDEPAGPAWERRCAGRRTEAAAASASRDDERATVLGGVASFGAFLAIGCPVCNKLALLLLGTSGALSIWAPIQPILGAASLALLAGTAVWRLRLRATGATCAV